MTKKIVIILSAIIGALLIAAIIVKAIREDAWVCQDGQWVKHGNPSSPKPTAGCAGVNQNSNQNQDSSQNTNVNQPSATNSSSVSESGNIIVDSPLPNAIISSPVTISGQARVFENQFQYRLKDGDGVILAQGTITATGADPGKFGKYSASIEYTRPVSDIGTLELFDASAKDGTETDLVRVPVQFGPSGSVNVRLYFTTPDSAADCSQVKAVQRSVGQTEAVAKAALTLLLLGPTESEEQASYQTNIPQRTKLKSVVIENGTAKADFSEELNQFGGGSCRVAAIRAQISETLKQFSSVTNVIISVNGQTEDILQP